MSDPNRGAYSPHNEPPLAFDARQPIRGGGPAPLTLIVSGLVLIALVVGVVMFYQNGARQPGDEPKPVGAPVGEVKTPSAPAQATDENGLQIFQSDDMGVPSEAAPTFAPPPEQPAPRPVPPPVAPAPATPLPDAPPPATTTPATPPAKPAPTPATPAATAPAKPAPAQPAPAATAQPKPPAPKPTPAPAATTPTPAPAASSGPARVQIGAYSSAAMADKGWNDVASQALGAMAGKGKKVEPVEVGGKTLYRTYITGFDSKEDAQAFCARLGRAPGTCLVR